MTTDDDTPAARFSRALALAGLTTGQFARETGIPLARVREIREGAEPTAREVIDCANACDVRTSWVRCEVPLRVPLDSLPAALRGPVERLKPADRENFLLAFAATGAGVL